MSIQEQELKLKILDDLEVLLSDPDKRVKNWKHAAENKDGIEVLRGFYEEAVRFCILGGAEQIEGRYTLIIDSIKSDISDAKHRFFPKRTFRRRWSFKSIKMLLNKTRVLIRSQNA